MDTTGMGRKPFRWIVQLMVGGDASSIVQTEVEAHWSPDAEGTETAVGEAAASRAWIESSHDAKQRIPFTPVAVSLVTD